MCRSRVTSPPCSSSAAGSCCCCCPFAGSIGRVQLLLLLPGPQPMHAAAGPEQAFRSSFVIHWMFVRPLNDCKVAQGAGVSEICQVMLLVGQGRPFWGFYVITQRHIKQKPV
jgi:hypothetical protein